MARSVAGRGPSGVHEALAAFHDREADRVGAAFGGRLGPLHRQQAELCRTGAVIVVSTVELCLALAAAGDSRWRRWQHNSSDPGTTGDAAWAVDEAGRITGPLFGADGTLTPA